MKFLTKTKIQLITKIEITKQIFFNRKNNYSELNICKTYYIFLAKKTHATYKL